MSYQAGEIESDCQDRSQVRALWNALMLAPSALALETARQELQKASSIVRRAVTEAIVHFWQQGKHVEAEENPSD